MQLLKIRLNGTISLDWAYNRLGATAFRKVLSRKQSGYKETLAFLKEMTVTIKCGKLQRSMERIVIKHCPKRVKY